MWWASEENGKLDFRHPCFRRLLKGKIHLWIWVIWVGKVKGRSSLKLLQEGWGQG